MSWSRLVLLERWKERAGSDGSPSPPLKELPFPSEYMDEPDEALDDRVATEGRARRGLVGDEGVRAPDELDEDAFAREVEDRVRCGDGGAGEVAATFRSEAEVDVIKTGNVSGTTMCTAEGVMKEVEVEASVDEDECGWTMTVTLSSNEISAIPVRPVSPIVHRLEPLTLGSANSTSASHSLEPTLNSTVASASRTFVTIACGAGGGVDARRPFLLPPTDEDDEEAEGDLDESKGGSIDIGEGSRVLLDGRLPVVNFGEKNDVRRDAVFGLPDVGDSMSGAVIEKEASEADESIMPIS